MMLKPFQSCEADLFHYYPAKIDVQSLSRKSYVEDLSVVENLF